MTNKYWWQNLYRNCEKHVINRETCSLRALNRKEKAFHFTWILNLFEKINIDCIHLFQSKLIRTFIMIKNDLIEWIKTRVLFNIKTKTVAKFLWKNIICCFECFESIVMNEDFKNKIVTEKLLNRYKIQIKLIRLIMYRLMKWLKKHRSFINVLSKLIKKKIEWWFQHLHAILWIDRIIVRNFINITFFRFLYKHDAILFIEIKYSTW